MYIKITNETEGFSRLYLELLGVSTKRDNDDTIGQFGSGTKFAPIYALRNGWEWVNTGHDEDGLYTMWYDIDNDNPAGIDVVQFVYEDEDRCRVVKNSSYSSGAGELGWDSPFQIFREAFANALDAHYEFGSKYWIDLVEEVGQPKWGEFSVYITADDGLLEIYNNFDRYFSINRTDVIHEDTLGAKIYEKLPGEKEGGVRIYHKGVLVYGPEIDGLMCQSLYDYDLPKVSLNEERTLKSVVSNELKAIAELFGANQKYWDKGISKVVNDIVDKAAYNDNDGVFEWRNAPYVWAMSKYDDYFDVEDDSCFGHVFTKKCMEEYTDSVTPEVAFVSEDAAGFGEIYMKLKERGYVGITVSKAMYNLLESTGAKDRMDKNVLGAEFDNDFVELEPRDQRFFDLAQETLVSYDMDILCYPIKVIKSTERNKHILGKAVIEEDGGFIILNESLIKSRNMKQLVATMVHELDHLISEVGDNTREFRDVADSRLGELILKHYCDKSHLLSIMREE